MFLMSYAYNPQSLKPSGGPEKSFAIGRFDPSNRVNNDEAVAMKDSTSNVQISKMIRKKF